MSDWLQRTHPISLRPIRLVDERGGKPRLTSGCIIQLSKTEHTLTITDANGHPLLFHSGVPESGLHPALKVPKTWTYTTGVRLHLAQLLAVTVGLKVNPLGKNSERFRCVLPSRGWLTSILKLSLTNSGRPKLVHLDASWNMCVDLPKNTIAFRLRVPPSKGPQIATFSNKNVVIGTALPLPIVLTTDDTTLIAEIIAMVACLELVRFDYLRRDRYNLYDYAFGNADDRAMQHFQEPPEILALRQRAAS